ncbi:MAG: hypothetical protein M1570_14230, partial [Chloroflexi bacterium]|nr:hypothetical protein [Chloroflexota bacterium]
GREKRARCAAGLRGPSETRLASHLPACLTALQQPWGGTLELLTAQLLSEQAARSAAANSPCGTFMGHPEGVWLLLVRGPFEGTTRTMRLFLDAKSGDQLCGEEVNPEATPWPTMPPGVTATPVKK